MIKYFYMMAILCNVAVSLFPNLHGLHFFVSLFSMLSVLISLRDVRGLGLAFGLFFFFIFR
ncbi:hypothetical protein QS257_21420 [Terrilactibacillus sp. S3-3]|nr:hypothetical protein QS257_21420 [Terrilactibacillus sp. S3-3]